MFIQIRLKTHTVFVVDKAALGQALLLYRGFTLSLSFHSSRRYAVILATENVK